jgi:DNA-binding CsgD family transcriptional regulator
MEIGIVRLTSKELSILKMIADGKTSAEIAELLCLSLPTIKWYRKKIRTKFDADTTIETVRKAIEMGLI